jgi:hypothetical protein
MKIGIISEGHSDRAVICNLLERMTGLDSSDIIPVLPIEVSDETDLALLSKAHFGGWSAVKNECESRELIDLFFERLGNDFLVIHMDTAESAQYDIAQPAKDANYVRNIRELLIAVIKKWLGTEDEDNLLFAIAVEEIDAWLLTTIEDRDSTKSADAKKRLEFKLGMKTGKLKPDYKGYYDLSMPFKEVGLKDFEKFLTRNESLLAFCQEVNQKVLNN